MPTGLDLLKQELIEAGYTRSQVDSKVVVGVLNIVSKNGSEYVECARLENDIRQLKKEIESLELYKKRLENESARLARQDNSIYEELQRMAKEIRQYIEEFDNRLLEAETPEARDALRIAQMFVESVRVDTKYDNTAFIIGLAQILACGKTAAIDELRKINKKIPYVGTSMRSGEIRHELNLSDEKRDVKTLGLV